MKRKYVSSGKTASWDSEELREKTVGWSWEEPISRLRLNSHGVDVMSEGRHVKLEDLGFRLVRSDQL